MPLSRIIVVGLNPERDVDTAALSAVAGWLKSNGRSELGDLIETGNLDVYDMTTRPEKGDALDALGEDVALVIALHLFGMDGRTFGAGRPESWGYNRSNSTWLSRCSALGVPLACFGEQPVNAFIPLPSGVKRTQISNQIWMYENA